MSEKTLAGLGVILVALLAIWGGVSLFSSLGGESSDEGGELAAALAGLSEDAVTRVVLSGPSDTVTLERSDGAWSADGFDTDSAAMARFWSAVTGTTVRDLVATNPTNHARLGVVADSAWTLEFHRAEGEPARFLVGDQGASFNSAYVRLPGQDRVYSLEGELRSAAAHDLEHWRNKTVVAVDTSRVQRVEVDRGDERYVLTRDSAGWLVDGEAADGPTARSLVGVLADLRAQGFAPDTADFEGGEERRRVVALDQAGDTLATVEIASTPESVYLVRTPAREWLLELPSWRVSRLTPERTDLVASGDGGG